MKSNPVTSVGDDAGQPRLGDAFGKCLRACWSHGARPNSVYEVLERDDGTVFTTDAALWFSRSDAWTDPERWACKHARGRVLDIGCGAGRHSLELIDRGLTTLGIDESPGAVHVALARGVPATTASLQRFQTDEPYDTLLLLGNNLGLLGSRQTAPEVLEHLASLARPGAQLLATSRDPGTAIDPIQREYVARNEERGQFPGQFTLRVRFQNLATPWFDYLYLSISQLEQLVARGPWIVQDYCATGAQFGVRLRLKT